ncbi:MAG TPA: hypothetical protein VF677_00580 [Flavobacterium sp.]|jgi:hypothetical protein
MGLLELKEKIKLQIEDADERLLKIVSSVFDNYLGSTENRDQLSNEEKEAIDAAIYQIDDQMTQSHDIVMEETKAKYSKYFKSED